MSTQNKYINNFLNQGYCIIKSKEIKKLKRIKKKIEQIILNLLKKNLVKKKEILEKAEKDKNLLINFHKYVEISDLNHLRMKIYSQINDQAWFKDYYYKIAGKYLNEICGNEIAMQRKVNLSIQIPNDDSSLLPIHSDVWSGCSPFEVVVWIPMSNVYKTSSMYVLPLKESKKMYNNFNKNSSLETIEKKISKKIKFLKINFGEILIFSHQIIHGNKVNKEKITRFSFNCRFKSLFSPYDEKGLAETFFPLEIKPASTLGMNYEHPKF
tara:strand:- start:33 stop:836 length:804 start_codon:yes stop_codon:yes gene_type:complete